jgi:sugar phosphate isomerase/epimerase
MRLDVFKALWGMEGPLESQLERIAAAGYAGAELLVPGPEDLERMRRALAATGLEAIPLIITWTGDPEAFRREVDRALALSPRQITSHSASDAMSHAEGVEFLGRALEVERGVGVPIAHETHRGHLLGTPWQTAAILRELPALRIAADYSHWVVVAERLLEDREEDLALANAAALHVHARVGHPEGPQVNDPRAPENTRFVERHETWWRDIIRRQAEAGAERATVTPEYGPPPYLPTIPRTGEPVADLWDVCLWGADRMRALHREVMGA